MKKLAQKFTGKSRKTINITFKQHKRLSALRDKTKIPISAMVERALDQYLEGK